MTLAEMHSNGALAALVPVNLNEKGTEISVLVHDWNGCMQSRQRFLHQLADGCARHVPECSTSRRKSERRRNEANCLKFEQTAHRQTRMGSSRPGTACCGEVLVTAPRWCGGARGTTTNSHCWARGATGGGAGDQFVLRERVACQWCGRCDDPTFLHDRGGTNSLQIGAWLADCAYGVVTTRMGAGRESAYTVLRGDREARAARAL